MAQYLMSVLDDRTNSATDEEMEQIHAFNRRIQADGNWVFAGGLGGPDTCAVVDGRGAEPVFTDGPYLESKEFIGGFWIIEAPDLDTARRIAAEGSRACNRRVELQPFLTL